MMAGGSDGAANFHAAFLALDDHSSCLAPLLATVPRLSFAARHAGRLECGVIGAEEHAKASQLPAERERPRRHALN
jgi:hypothetical protein